ncbi:MAG: TVP38/TMEM64 family protein [Nanoarchaeota archaeon]|nr:TVP38/TMEM64 family protein [Nanoarchaeota archaeon]
MKRNHIIINFIAIIILLILGGLFFYDNFVNIVENRDILKSFLLQFKLLAPIVLIVFIALQVLFAPIPGQAAGLVSGFLYGPILGTLYSMTGLIIGSYIAFFLSRKFGRPLVEKFVHADTLKKFDHFSQENGLIALFLIYLLPVLPDDAICYIAGLTKIRMRILMIISTIGRLPGFIVLNLVGSGLASQTSKNSLIIFLVFMIISIILFFYKDKIEKIMIKIINRFKHKSNNN